MRFLLRALIRSCFWLKVEEPDEEDWKELALPQDKGCILMFNHTSMFDGFLMAAIMPASLTRRCKSLMAAYTFKTPVLGEIFRLVGHEPVYFLKDDEGKFSVDKVRQAPVNERIRAHVAGGGVLAFCPEGTVNRKDQTKCLPLRRGSFQLAVDLRLPIYGISALGQHRSWPGQGARRRPARDRVAPWVGGAELCSVQLARAPGPWCSTVRRCISEDPPSRANEADTPPGRVRDHVPVGSGRRTIPS